MAFYKPAEDWEQYCYATNPEKFVGQVKEQITDNNQYFKLDYATIPYYDIDSIDVQVDASMRTVYVYIRNRRQESFFAQFDFTEPVDTVYKNHEGETISGFSRVLCISNFFEAIKVAAEHDVRDVGTNLGETLPQWLFTLKGRLSVVGRGSIVQGNVIHDDEHSLSFRLCTQFVADEEHKELLSETGGEVTGDNALEIDGMEGHEFESLCAELLQKNGFSNVQVTRGSGDQGIDVLATKDFVKYGFQCKCYSSDIGNKAVQEAHAGKAFYGCNVAVVITNRHFTPSAVELAEQTGVVLWDRDVLLSMAKTAGMSIKEEGSVARHNVKFREDAESVKRIYESALSLIITINEAGNDGKLFGIDNESVQKLFFAQILYYMFWVIDAGVGVSSTDAYIVSKISGQEFNAAAIEELIHEDFVPEDFAVEMPSIMKAAAQVMDQTGLGDPASFVIPLFESIGKLLASVDEAWGEERMERVSSYSSMLRRMIDLSC